MPIIMIVMIGVMVMTQAQELPRYTCYRTADKVVVDGRLSERTWKAAPAMELTLWNGAGAPKRPTRVQMAWDDGNLYLAYHVSDDDIRCTLKKRDARLWEEEVVEFFVDPGGDLRHYFEFEWNALGTCVDLLILELPVRNLDGALGWDAKGMKWAVQVDGTIGRKGGAKGWTLEVAIPFTVFIDAPSTPPQDGDEWRMNLYRIERSDPEVEYTCWSPVLGEQVSYHRPERFGYLKFVQQPLR